MWVGIAWEGLLIHHFPYIVDFRSAVRLPYEHRSVANADTRSAPIFWVASLLAGSTSSRPFFCFLCNLRSIHDAQGTDARPCEVSHRYVKSPHQPLRFDVEEGATLNYYNRPKSGPTTSPEGVNDKGGMVYSIKYYLRKCFVPSYLTSYIRGFEGNTLFGIYSRIYTAEYDMMIFY